MENSAEKSNECPATPARRPGPLPAIALALLVAAAGVLLFAGDRLELAFAGPVFGCPPEPAPEGVQRVDDARLRLELAADRRRLLQGGDGLVRLELKLAAAERGAATRQATDFVVVLDHSGSMGDYDKMSHAREAVAGLIDRLEDGDRFALVIYDDRVALPIPLESASPAARERWKGLVAGIGPEGGTALSLGLDAGLKVLDGRLPARQRGAARLLLVSDGLANQGDTSREGLLRRAGASAGAGAPLTAIGVGEDFDENLMGGLADSGSGNFYYLRDAVALAQVFAGELGATRETVAESVEIAMRLAPGVELVDAAGYPVERHGAVAVFRPGSLFAGQERRIWLTVKVAGDGLGACAIGELAAHYHAGGEAFTVAGLEAPAIERVVGREDFLAGLDRERWSRSVVEEDYGRLQQKVAEHVKSGDRDAAKREIADYAIRVRALNEAVDSKEVSQNLAETRRMEAEVDDAFTGRDQAAKQNSLSKVNQAAGWDKRRAGAKKTSGSPPPPGH